MDDDRPLDPAEERLRRAACEGCAESRLLMSRRSMLGVSAGLFSWAFMPRFAEAASGHDPRLLIVVLRGGMDGISTVVPFGDHAYVSMRGKIAIPAAKTIKLNSFFGLHPALKNFGAYYKAGDAAVVHATCVPLRTRSHFDCQDNLENGLPGTAAANTTGWVNRLLTALPAGAPIKSKGAIQIGEAPLILRGPAPVLGWSPTWFTHVEDPTLYLVRSLYHEKDPALLSILDRGLKADRLAERGAPDDGSLSSLRKGFRGAGRLVAASDGPRIAVLAVDGFDTHIYQGGETGALANVLGELDEGIHDFKTAVGSAWSQTVVLMVTEFGRTVHINGDEGTDHGVATVALLAGGAVNGGKVFGDWPGLSQAKLYEGSDLRPTSDTRSIFKGVLRDHIGVPSTLLNSTIFPESGAAPPMLDLIQSGTTAAAATMGFSPAPLRSEPPIARYRRGVSTSMAQRL